MNNKKVEARATLYGQSKSTLARVTCLDTDKGVHIPAPQPIFFCSQTICGPIPTISAIAADLYVQYCHSTDVDTSCFQASNTLGLQDLRAMRSLPSVKRSVVEWFMEGAIDLLPLEVVPGRLWFSETLHFLGVLRILSNPCLAFQHCPRTFNLCQRREWRKNSCKMPS